VKTGDLVGWRWNKGPYSLESAVGLVIETCSRGDPWDDEIRVAWIRDDFDRNEWHKCADVELVSEGRQPSKV